MEEGFWYVTIMLFGEYKVYWEQKFVRSEQGKRKDVRAEVAVADDGKREGGGAPVHRNFYYLPGCSPDAQEEQGLGQEVHRFLFAISKVWDILS